MKIFISSVRSGLEAERDCLPGLIMALGHQPQRFEDFTAQSTPSREACLRGVDASDVYLLLLGPKYGHIFPETGQSATHDEWVAAVTKGMPRLVFRKTDVDVEPQQEAFAKVVGDYGHGIFYSQFSNVADLQTKVVQAVRTLEMQPGTLTYSPLQSPVDVQWREDRSNPRWNVTSDPWLELHAIPLGAAPRSARQLRQLPDQLVTSLRNSGALPITAGAEPRVDSDAVVVELPTARRHWDGPHAGALVGLRVNTAGYVSLWWSLPRDRMGAILDPEDLTSTVASGLRLIGALRVLQAAEAAIGIGLSSASMVSEGRVTGVARNSATMSVHGDGPVRIAPDEAVSSAAFDRGAEEVAASLVRSLLEAFRARR